jgi:Ser/Thr protein kinase RdoA (MazF antagonist)
MNNKSGFSDLTPDAVHSAVEEASGINLTGLISPFPSYINRVYEIETEDGERLVAKFYRPNRWSESALREEHEFLHDCAESDIPVVSPLRLSGGDTLGMSNGYFFTLFPKKSGRMFELNNDNDYLRAGSLLGRIHAAGKKRNSNHRTVLDPSESTRKDVEELLSGTLIQGSFRTDFKKITDAILELIVPMFSETIIQRIHGDCHLGNILCRPSSDGNYQLMIIDFDDMVMGPAVHDLWLLLPDRFAESKREFNLLVEGYEQFFPFDYTSSRLIEPLRAMRMIYFLAWCARQYDDFQFRNNFPQWGSEKFWENEIRDLKNQLDEIKESLL